MTKELIAELRALDASFPLHVTAEGGGIFARAADALQWSGAEALNSAADEWAADPDSWGDNDKDYRNELRGRAAKIRKGASA